MVSIRRDRLRAYAAGVVVGSTAALTSSSTPGAGIEWRAAAIRLLLVVAVLVAVVETGVVIKNRTGRSAD